MSLKKCISIDYGGAKIVCIDDFALRKGQRYGTVMVDAETGKVIGLLESGDTGKVTEWLKKFPDIEIRFHLLKNISQYAKDFISHSVPPSILIEREEVEGCAEEPQGNHKRHKYDYKTEWGLIMAVQEERKNN